MRGDASATIAGGHRLDLQSGTGSAQSVVPGPAPGRTVHTPRIAKGCLVKGVDVNRSNRHAPVRGWLLVLCLMLTIIGPLVSVGLMAHTYEAFAPNLVGSAGLQAAVFGSLSLSTCSVAFGVYAGLRLWLVKPNAVVTAKYALLAGLAADIVTSVIAVAAGPMHAVGPLLRQVEIDMIPGLLFFTLCFAYLNRSSRVRATYLAKQR